MIRPILLSLILPLLAAYPLAGAVLEIAAPRHEPPSVSTASSEGRVLTAWIERGPSSDELLVWRTESTGSPTLVLTRHLERLTGVVVVASTPEVDLVIWRDGTLLYVTRLEPSGEVRDLLPITPGRTTSQQAPAVAWNGSEFLIVWSDTTLMSMLLPASGAPGPIRVLQPLQPSGEVPYLYFRTESPSLAWNGVHYLMSFVGYPDGGISIGAPYPRSLYVVRLDAAGELLDTHAVRPDSAFAPPLAAASTRPFIASASPSPVASNGGEFVLVHVSRVGVQLIRITTASGAIEIGEAAEIQYWARHHGQAAISAGEQGYAVALTNRVDSGASLIVETLDGEGRRVARFSEPLQGIPSAVAVTSVSGHPLPLVGGGADDRGFVAQGMPSSGGAMTSMQRPLVWYEGDDGGGYLRWSRVEGATEYVVTVFVPTPYETHAMSPNRQFLPADADRYLLWSSPYDASRRVTVQALGPDGISLPTEPVQPGPRQRAVRR